MISSKRFGVKARGLKQSQGGHYLLPIDQFSDSLSVPADLHVPSHLEVMPLRCSGSGALPASQSTTALVLEATPHAGPSVGGGIGAINAREPMGERGHGARGNRRGGDGGRPEESSQETQGQDYVFEEASKRRCHKFLWRPCRCRWPRCRICASRCRRCW
jgi:hypothetical protein